MNETLKSILNRRSIRGYKSEQIKEEELQTIVNAGLYAPSAMNQQSWHLTVIQNAEVIKKLNEVCRQLNLKSSDEETRKRASDPSFNIFYGAPTVIIVSGDEKAIAPQADCSAALENMFVEAASFDIGSCWIGAAQFIFGSEEGKALRKELGIPDGYNPLHMGTFGYKAMATPEAAPRKENAVNYIR